MTNFGATFKKARESKGISINQISAETRISVRFLLAIESEEFHLLPGGVFNRGFIRAYAEKVDLDPDQAIADYERLGGVPETSEIPPTPIASPRKRERQLYSVAIGVLILLSLIVYVGMRGPSNTTRIASPPAAPPLTTAPSLPPPTPEPAPPPDPASVVPERQPQVAAQALRIDIEAKETTWIKVYADGNTINPGEILEPGMTRHFAAQDSIVLSTGNAGGLALKINDMPAKELGQKGEVRQFRITPNNLKDFIG